MHAFRHSMFFHVLLCLMLLPGEAWLTRLSAHPPQLHDSVPAYEDLSLDLRAFEAKALEAYRQDPDFRYEEGLRSLDELNWWERFLERVRRFIFGQSEAGQTFWKVLLYALAVGAVLFVVFGLLKIGPRSFFGKSSGQLTPEFAELDEDIHAMDFDQLVTQALQQQNYRQALRLLYLETLKFLSEKGHIEWQADKTNLDYRLELAGTRWQGAFDELTLHYEYVWYGDFPLDQVGFERLQQVFQPFRQPSTSPLA